MGDKDLCLLNTMIFEGPQSSGSSCQGGIYNRCPPAPPLAVERRVCHAGVAVQEDLFGNHTSAVLECRMM